MSRTTFSWQHVSRKTRENLRNIKRSTIKKIISSFDWHKLKNFATKCYTEYIIFLIENSDKNTLNITILITLYIIRASKTIVNIHKNAIIILG